jgi:hypothetical protein
VFDALLDTFSKSRKFIGQEKLYVLYEQVSKDIQSGIKDEGVWAKAFAESEGDEQKAKAKYIELMVERLVLAEQAAIETGNKPERLKQDEEKKKKNKELAEKKRIKMIEKAAYDAELKVWTDGVIRKIRIPCTILLLGGSIWAAKEFYLWGSASFAESILASLIVVAGGAYLAWCCFWMGVD